ncbi:MULTISPECIES: response regulator [Caloramator]|uniref:Stage 0 sporulation protein A homolog n=2 Tax=Caloramator TaxID=44258 RepID=G0V4F1_9CLOT|nr:MULTISPECIES: response regulator [Caloramator]MDO6356001.1 response regulator [Caloramator sp. CAR-1]CCC57991.1 response regulator receiver [Caloramator australicus RC3]
MLKILIVDDEYLVLDSLKMIISKNFEDVKVIGTASSGREAIEKAIELKPDAIFMDIHMPGIDGIEAIRQIKAANNDVFFVILTAYEYFDYAKEALNLGVFEYLLKPINKSKVIETISKLSAAVENKRRNFLIEVELKDKINKIIPFLEAQFVSYKMFNVGTLNEVQFYEGIFNMDLKHGYAMCILFSDFEDRGKVESLKGRQDKQNFYDLLKIKLKGLTNCLIGRPLSDRIVAFIPVNEAENINDIKDKSVKLGKRLTEKLMGSTDIKFKIGIGRVYDLEGFPRSCSEAYLAAATKTDGIIIHYEDIPLNLQSSYDYNSNIENLFLNSIITGNFNEAHEIFKEIFVWLNSIYLEDIDRIKAKLIELVFLIERAVSQRIDNFSDIKQKVILSLLKISNGIELRMQFLQFISDLAYQIQNSKNGNIDGIVSKVLEYINKNYHQDISLHDIAKSVNLSYHYLSKIFKDKIGKGFIEYLTELRIEKSMQLLINQNLSIKEICQQIGYSDPNYYCKAFKRVTGMTPTEYRLSRNVRGDNLA